MSATVIRVNPWEKDGKTRYFVDLMQGSDKVESVSFSEKAADLEIGKPLPEGWELKPPKQEGWKPMLKAPKAQRGGGFGGGAAAWRNTKEGAHAEQERMDRRTALMQAVAITVEPNQVLKKADEFYSWLRSTSGAAPVAPATGAGSGSEPPARTAAPVPSSATGASSGRPASGGHADVAPAPAGPPEGEGSAGACAHRNVDDKNPAGMPLPPGKVRCLVCGKVFKP